VKKGMKAPETFASAIPKPGSSDMSLGDIAALRSYFGVMG
jgi:hypothetical protein